MAADDGSRIAELKRADAHPLSLISNWPDIAKKLTRLAREWGEFPNEEERLEVEEIIRRETLEILRQMPDAPRREDFTNFFTHTVVATRFCMLWKGGCRILSISPDLQEAIGLSELDTVRLGDVRLPHERFYVAFPGGLNLQMEDTDETGAIMALEIEGAYVLNNTVVEDFVEYEVVLTAKPVDDGDRIRPWPLRPLRHFIFEICGQAEDTFESAVGFALRSELIRDKLDYEIVDDFREQTTAALPEGSGAAVEIPAQMVSAVDHNITFKQCNLEVAKKALAAILGVTFALTAKPELEDKTPRWPPESPDKLVRDHATARSAKAARNVEIALLKSGFLPVHRVSLDKLRADAERSTRPGGVFGRSVRPHWRAGHFRRQPYGPGRTKTRLIWVLPSFITGNASGEAHPGRIEEISRG